MVYVEEIIADRAKSCYGLFAGAMGLSERKGLCWNYRIVLGLSDLILNVWNEWRADTRHYRPLMKEYKGYVAIVDKAEGRLDPEGAAYETAKQVVKDCRNFLKRVVLYRVDNGKCRVM